MEKTEPFGDTVIQSLAALSFPVGKVRESDVSGSIRNTVRQHFWLQKPAGESSGNILTWLMNVKFQADWLKGICVTAKYSCGKGGKTQRETVFKYYTLFKLEITFFLHS